MWSRRMRKLNYRVVFPFELKLRNTSDDCANVDDFYDLFAVVVHVGQGPNHGELPVGMFQLGSSLLVHAAMQPVHG